MSKHLLVITGIDRNRTFPLPEKGTVPIGRGIESVTLLKDHSVSRRHCVLRIDGERFLLSDAQSAGGTFVNGRRVAKEQPLNDGDIIRIGETELRLEETDLALLGTQVNLNPPAPAPFEDGREARRALREASIEVACPNTGCGRRLRARQKVAGVPVRCPSCGHAMLVPERTTVVAQPVLMPLRPFEQKAPVRERVPAVRPWSRALLAPFRAVGAWFGRGGAERSSAAR